MRTASSVSEKKGATSGRGDVRQSSRACREMGARLHGLDGARMVYEHIRWWLLTTISGLKVLSKCAIQSVGPSKTRGPDLVMRRSSVIWSSFGGAHSFPSSTSSPTCALACACDPPRLRKKRNAKTHNRRFGCKATLANRGSNRHVRTRTHSQAGARARGRGNGCACVWAWAKVRARAWAKVRA
eukprot:6174957-Pleurochrysis_carterae.AAC.3